MALKHSKISAKSDGGDSSLVQPSDWNAGHVLDADGVDIPTHGTEPAAPAADNIRLFSAKLANGRAALAGKGPSGVSVFMQAHFGTTKIAMAQPAGGGTTVSTFGMAALGATGTATTLSVSTTNIYTQTRGVEYLVTTASTTAVAGFRNSSTQWWIGNAAGFGGFTFVCRWGPATGVSTSTHRAFVGLRGSGAAPTDVQPSSLVNILGMGWDSADTNIQFLCNDGSGAASKVDLGTSFPVPTSNRSKVYEVQLFCAPNGTTVYWRVLDVGTGAVAQGSVNTDIPANTILLTPLGYCSVGGTSSVVGIALFNLYLETDN